MPSPFPGMNPFLETAETWEDFHNRFITHAAEALAPQMGEDFFVRIEVRLYLHELSGDERRYFGRADVGVTGEQPGQAAAVAAPAAPILLSLPATETQREAFLEVRSRRDRRVIAVVELLSPTNKRPGPDRDQYLAKRRTLLASATHLVEIDLLRGGLRPAPPELPPADYYALVSRAQDRPKVGFWPVRLRERLPELPVPLTADRPPARLDLQATLDEVYERAGYGHHIYLDTPEPPLSPEDAAWARRFVPAGAAPGAAG